jgi:hypothetical protein
MRIAVVSWLAITLAACASTTGDPSGSGSDPEALSRDAGADAPACDPAAKGGGVTRPAAGDECADAVKKCYSDGDATGCDVMKAKCRPSGPGASDCGDKLIECMAAGGDKEKCTVASCGTQADPGPGPANPCLTKVKQCYEQGIDAEMCMVIEKACDEPPPPDQPASCTKSCIADDTGVTCTSSCVPPPSAACVKTCTSDGMSCKVDCPAPSSQSAPAQDACVSKVVDCLETNKDASTCKALAEQCNREAPGKPGDPQAPPS